MSRGQRLTQGFVAGGALLVGLLAWPALASAECESDADCAADEICVIMESCAAPEPGDAPDSDDHAEPAECDSFAMCQPMHDSHAPSPMPWPDMDMCEADSDCDDGWRCAELDEMNTCLPPWANDCNIDAECAEGFVCFQESGYCAPQWLAPCGEDADCGEGFTCETQLACECPPSQGGGAAPGGEPGAEPGWSGPNGDAPPIPDGDPMPEPAFRGEFKDSSSEDRCTCTPMEEMACELIREECDPAGDDCRAGWSCDLDPSGVVSSCTEEGGWAGSDSVPPPPDCSDEGDYICVPDELADVFRLRGGLSGGGDFEDAIGAPAPGRPGGGDPSPRPPGEQDDRAGAGDPDDGTRADPYPRGDGCSSVPAAPGAAPLMLLLGLALLRRRGTTASRIA